MSLIDETTPLIDYETKSESDEHKASIQFFSPRIHGGLMLKRTIADDSPMPPSYYSPASLKLCLTIFLTAITIIIAVETPQVSTVWTWAGSSVSLFVGFVIPTISYIVFSQKKHLDYDSSQYIAWALLIYSVIVMILCTTNNIMISIHSANRVHPSNLINGHYIKDTHHHLFLIILFDLHQLTV